MMRENSFSLNDIVFPLFVDEKAEQHIPIPHMPGIYRIPLRLLQNEIKSLANLGLKAVLLFGVSNHKDELGSDSWSSDGLVARMVSVAKDSAPEMLIIADCCLCEYTTHGHCGIFQKGEVDNDGTLLNLARQAVVAANSGADIIAPSSMMDGQVSYLRRALDQAGHTATPIMSYSSKFASSLYGPFRSAAGCGLSGDRLTYQMDPLNGREALRESLADEAEGADILMVKPGLPYLDVIAKLRERTDLPIAAYQVSGEYAMIKFASMAGAIDEHRVVRETLGAFKRAGADLIISYFAKDIAQYGLNAPLS